MSSPLSALALVLAWSIQPLALQTSPVPLDPEEIEAAAPVIIETEPEIEAAPTPAYTPRPELSEAEKTAIVRKAAAALEAVTTAKGRFVQIAPDQTSATGDFALRRPGRMRFVYDDPNPLLLISDGATVAIEDRDLETVDRVPLASTQLGIVLDDSLDFESEAEVVSVRVSEDYVAISLRDRSGEAEGELTLTFTASDYALVGWRTVDEAGGVTSVQLLDVETGVKLNPRLFRIEDAEDEDDRRR